jgi:hypothetical protein
MKMTKAALGWVSPGNIVHTFHDYERQHLLNHTARSVVPLAA